jgi:hypothetical protein
MPDAIGRRLRVFKCQLGQAKVEPSRGVGELTYLPVVAASLPDDRLPQHPKRTPLA